MESTSFIVPGASRKRPLLSRRAWLVPGDDGGNDMKRTNWKKKYAVLKASHNALSLKTSTLIDKKSAIESDFNRIVEDRVQLKKSIEVLASRLKFYQLQTEQAATYFDLAGDYFAALYVESSASAFKKFAAQMRQSVE